MHPALRKGPLFLQKKHPPFSTFYKYTPYFISCLWAWATTCTLMMFCAGTRQVWCRTASAATCPRWRRLRSTSSTRLSTVPHWLCYLSMTRGPILRAYNPRALWLHWRPFERPLHYRWYQLWRVGLHSRPYRPRIGPLHPPRVAVQHGELLPCQLPRRPRKSRRRRLCLNLP